MWEPQTMFKEIIKIWKSEEIQAHNVFSSIYKLRRETLWSVHYYIVMSRKSHTIYCWKRNINLWHYQRATNSQVTWHCEEWVLHRRYNWAKIKERFHEALPVTVVRKANYKGLIQIPLIRTQDLILWEQMFLTYKAQFTKHCPSCSSSIIILCFYTKTWILRAFNTSSASDSK